MKIAAVSVIAIVLFSTAVKGHEDKGLQLSPSAAGPGQDHGKQPKNGIVGKMDNAQRGMMAGGHPCGPAPGPFPNKPNGAMPEGHTYGPIPGPLPVLKHGMLEHGRAGSHGNPCGKPSVAALGPFPGADFPSQNGSDSGPRDGQGGPGFNGPGGRKLK